MQRRWGRRPPIPVRRLADRADHVSDVPAGQLTEPDPTQMRNQMVLDMVSYDRTVVGRIFVRVVSQ
jgi:hypothetical protein